MKYIFFERKNDEYPTKKQLLEILYLPGQKRWTENTNGILNFPIDLCKGCLHREMNHISNFISHKVVSQFCHESGNSSNKWLNNI